MPDFSILTTVYNRDHHTLRNTFYHLSRNDLSNTELIVVDDGSTIDYEQEKQALDNHGFDFQWLEIDTKADRPETYQIAGCNNPVYAWNRALDAASGSVIIVIASDCIVPPHTLNAARRCGNAAWMASVVDMDSATIYCGPARVAPYGWVMSWDRSKHDLRWDENFLKGIDYDDNDFSARLGLATRRIDIDLGVTAYHQSHHRQCYTDGMLGHDINERYIVKKWGGIPWAGGDHDPLAVQKGKRGRMFTLHVSLKSEAEKHLEQHGIA